jgi:hypothetical protein
MSIVQQQAGRSANVSVRAHKTKPQPMGHPSLKTMEESKAKGPVCGRFPQAPACGCTIPCRVAMKEVQLYQVLPGLYLGPLQAAYKVRPPP